MGGLIPPNSSLMISSQAGTWARSCHCCPDHDVHDDDYVVVGDDDGDYVNDGDDDNSLGDDRSRDKKLGLFLLQKSIEQIRLKSRSDNFFGGKFRETQSNHRHQNSHCRKTFKTCWLRGTTARCMSSPEENLISNSCLMFWMFLINVPVRSRRSCWSFD